MCTVKRLYGRKILMQHDLAQKIHDILTFFTVGQFFKTNLANFGHVSAHKFFKGNSGQYKDKDHQRQLPCGVSSI